MPLTMLDVGKEAVISICRAKDPTKKYLEGMGVIPGALVSVISKMDGNLIVSIKGSRLALSRGIAQQLIVEV